MVIVMKQWNTANEAVMKINKMKDKENSSDEKIPLMIKIKDRR